MTIASDSTISIDRPLAVVTGASSGIGLALADQFAEHGFDLLVAAADEAIISVGAHWQRAGAQVERLQVDLSDPAGVETLNERITAAGRPVDAVAINAGVGVGGDFARQTDLDTELTLIDLNVRSSVHLAKLVVGPMVARGQGRVLFTSSIAATQSGPFEAVYAASKAFLGSFSEALREELKDTGVTVTALMPGPTDTNFFDRAGMDDTKVGAGSKDDPVEVAKQGYEALMKGDEYVVSSSLADEAMAVAAKVLPDAVTAKAHRSMAEPGSADK